MVTSNTDIIEDETQKKEIKVLPNLSQVMKKKKKYMHKHTGNSIE